MKQKRWQCDSFLASNFFALLSKVGMVECYFFPGNYLDHPNINQGEAPSSSFCACYSTIVCITYVN